MQKFVPQIMPPLIIIIQLAIVMACIWHIHQGKFGTQNPIQNTKAVHNHDFNINNVVTAAINIAGWHLQHGFGHHANVFFKQVLCIRIHGTTIVFAWTRALYVYNTLFQSMYIYSLITLSWGGTSWFDWLWLKVHLLYSVYNFTVP